MIKQELEKEEKKELKAEWKFKRQQLNKKRQEYFNDNELRTEEGLDFKINDNSIEVITKNITEVQNEDNDRVSHMLIYNENGEETEELTEQKKLKICINKDECNEDIVYTEEKYSELERNRLKVLGSNLGIDEKTSDCLSVHLNETKEFQHKDSAIIEVIENDSNKYSDLVRNRSKSLYSDFGRENKRATYFYQEEAELNKMKILGTHFSLGMDFADYEKVNKSIDKSISENFEKNCDFNKITINQDYNKSQISTENSLNISKCSLSLELANQEEKVCEDKISLNLDVELNDKKQINVSSTDKIDDQPESVTEHIGVNGVNWFRNCNKYDERVINIFNADNKIILPKQPLDYFSLLKGVPGSLKLVLDTQVRLVDEALLQMFLNEFKLLTEAGKLKKYFFLDGEFGKKLTSSLCMAMEKEKPSILLTFGVLRDVLAAVSQGDDKVSFIVKDTPAAFEHTNPQVSI